MQNPHERIGELDALRGIAALSVVLFHFTMFRDEQALGFKYGATGVDLFFMISGYVICMTLDRTRNALDFVRNRFLRLYPTYWVCVCLTSALLVVVLGEPIRVERFVANITMFQHYLRQMDIDGPYWTMIVEMLFYVLMLVVYAAGGLKRVLIGTLPMLLLSCLEAWSPITIFGAKLQNVLPLADYFPLFYLGMCFYRYRTKELSPALLFVLVSACYLIQLLLFRTGRMQKLLEVTEYAMVLLFWITIMFAFVNDALRFMAVRPLLFLGTISYALYLVHQTLTTRVIVPLLMDHGVGFWPSAVSALAVAIGTAALITFYVEKPIIKKYKQKPYEPGRKSLASLKAP